MQIGERAERLFLNHRDQLTAHHHGFPSTGNRARDDDGGVGRLIPDDINCSHFSGMFASPILANGVLC
jgi:hypothetical protein